MRIAFYPGSFDPVTNGHLDVLMRAFAVADKVVVGIGVHPGKAPLFSFEEREDMLRQAVADHGIDPARFSVVSFRNLVTRAAIEHGASLLVRGLRDGTDLDYEMQMAGMNGTMEPDLSTIFVAASPQTRHITATLVRQIAKLGGDVSAFVPAHVAAALSQRAATTQTAAD
ncbi:pantetheine-phosphate adenylyltransferase [Acuticoccus sp. I52.16.1]|uniref:pantetheine-phosphate adenylyltransferase n=1 Tax=Acuticoccus sp. I52.16.1 TaxID=2928472 RepID=UPI001FCF871C|nr:pantetheine-phosphate adenylyltransferase [Acuticoccus sp. I52.16.1]UOM33928.1 pantetheine-phosphate adenylyltransferase [Acuticoccus sp. I52.16.1]